MGYSVRYSEKAERDLENILAYIQEILLNPQAAERFYAKLENRLLNLRDMPYLFAKVKSEFWARRNYHRVPIDRYIGVYRIDEEEKIVRIMGIFSELEDYEHKL